MNLPAKVRRHVVLDTDTYNEVDDPFALAHLLLSPDSRALGTAAKSLMPWLGR